MKKNMSKKRVVVGLSGGVDCAVVAYLLKKKGFDVTGVYISCWNKVGCRAEVDRKDALKTAYELEIAFKGLDFKKEYKEKVFNYFLREYGEGRTPNPDILCNSVIKFGLFYDWAIKEGYDFVATGHYAQIKNQEEMTSKNLRLFTAKDLQKDQSYFLYKIKQEQLERILFPVGDLLKREVREMAEKAKLSVANKKDSMGICFVGDINVRDFLLEKYGFKIGKVVLADGTVVGEHDGYFLFNIGHRGGWRRKLKIKNEKIKNDELPKLYVTEIRKDKNEIVVGEKEECMRDEFSLSQIHKINEKEFGKEFEGCIKIRNTGDFLEAKFKKDGEKILVKLKGKAFGISNGQSGVMYKEEKEGEFEVLGGGIIE